jgi:hypothetical protein
MEKLEQMDLIVPYRYENRIEWAYFRGAMKYKDKSFMLYNNHERTTLVYETLKNRYKLI